MEKDKKLQKEISNEIFSSMWKRQGTSVADNFEITKVSDIFPYVPLFSVLSEEEMNEIGKKFRYEKFNKGDIIFNYGDAAEDTYIIKSGQVLLYREIDGDYTIEYSMVFKGDIFGEMSLISGSPRSLTAGVYSDTAELYGISKNDFLNILEKFPSVNLNMSRLLCLRLEETNRRLLEFMV